MTELRDYPVIHLDPALVAQIDTLARRLGLIEVGEDRVARRRGEVVRRLLLMWDGKDCRCNVCGLHCPHASEERQHDGTAVCPRIHAPEVAAGSGRDDCGSAGIHRDVRGSGSGLGDE